MNGYPEPSPLAPARAIRNGLVLAAVMWLVPFAALLIAHHVGGP